MKLLSVDDSILIFLSYGALVVRIGSSHGWCSAIIFVKHAKIVFVQVLSLCSTQCSADAWIAALLGKLPQMASCSANNANLDKNNFGLFYKIYWLVCSHLWPHMNEQCTKRKYNNYAIMHWYKFCYIFFAFEKFEEKTPLTLYIVGIVPHAQLFYLATLCNVSVGWRCTNLSNIGVVL